MIRSMSEPVTTRTIAGACGLGQSTVSMALRNDPRIPEQTRARVHETANRLGYRPDAGISRLMAGVRRKRIPRQLQTVAYVIIWESTQLHYFYQTYRAFREGAQQRALEFGYSLEDFLIHAEGISPKRLSVILRTRAIPGMIIAPVSLPYHSQDFQGLDINIPCTEHAVSAIGYSLASPKLNRVTHDHALGAEMAVNELRRRGYRRIGLVCSHAVHVRVQGRWLAGFQVAQFELPAGDQVRPLVMDDINNVPSFDQWLEKERPEVLIGIEMNEIRKHLNRRQMKIPEDIGLVSLDAIKTGGSYAGIHQRQEAVGAAAFDLLLAQLNRNERGVPAMRKTVLLEGEWVEGNSIVENSAQKAADKEKRSGVKGVKARG